MKIRAVFEGGGVRGIALAGAVDGAMQAGITFGQVAGTSSGSIVAALLAAGYTGQEMKQVIEDTPFESFLQRPSWIEKSKLASFLRLWLKKGLYSGDTLQTWIDEKLKAKGVCTFGDLPSQQLRFVASDISNGKLLLLPDDLSKYGLRPEKYSIARAVRMSASIPFFFDPVKMVALQRRSSVRVTSEISTQYIVDGALLSNFPLWIFDQSSNNGSPPVVGFQLVGKNESKKHRISGPLSMMQALVETMLGAHDERYIEQHNRNRTVKIPTLGISSTQFDLTSSQSMALFHSGQQAADRFFNQWNSIRKSSITGK